MKKVLGINPIIFVTFLLFLATDCKKDEIPTISTTTITGISATTAISGGNISSDGRAAITSRGICWTTAVNPTTAASKTVDGTGIGEFTSSIVGLTAGTTYHVRAYATNSVGTAYGADRSFSTLGGTPESITQPATNISATGATLNSTVIAHDISTTVTFEYGTSTSYGNTTTSTQSPVTGNNIINASADISGLIPGTTYHFRVKTVNSLGNTIGDDLTFTTATGIPSLTTSPVSNITKNSAISGGNIISDGGALITIRGLCYATSPNPTVNNDIILDVAGTGSFTSKLTCLSYATTYYVRAYAVNSIGTAYGDQLSFTTEINPLAFNPDLTYGSVLDIEGNCYKTIQIGSQTWMAENLRTTHYNNGDLIETTTDSLNQSYLNDTTLYIAKYQWVYKGMEDAVNEYGRLYTWYAATDKRGVCPVGWHVPSWGEWGILYAPYRIMSDTDQLIPGKLWGTELIEAGTSHWNLPDYPGTNESGFTALPAGARSRGRFYNITTETNYWSADKYRIVMALYVQIPSTWWWSTRPSTSLMDALDGLSIRCMKDSL
jgi:uncharacterized protein (TIGR02145 family)